MSAQKPNAPKVPAPGSSTRKSFSAGRPAKAVIYGVMGCVSLNYKNCEYVILTSLSWSGKDSTHVRAPLTFLSEVTKSERSTVIDELRTDTDSGTVVLYLYLSSKDDRLQKYRNLIGCLIHQLAKHAPSQASEVAELWKKRIDLSKTASELSASQSQASDGAASTSSSKEHRKAFSKDENDGLPSYAAAMAEVNAKPILAGDAVIRKILRTFSRAYVVVDALNELADGEDQHRRLLNLLFDLPDNTRVILTSTQEPEKDNSDKFRMCSIKANAEDLDLYATNRLQLRRDLSPDQIDKIILPAIRDRSKGL